MVESLEGNFILLFCFYFYYLTFFTKLFCFISYIFSFRPVDAKNFQTKFKRAEEAATKMLLPGAHSATDGEDGEDIPEWVSIFQKYWEHKKSHPSKSVVEEQKREERRTMQRTILPPVLPLGPCGNQIVNETSSNKSRQPSSNSLIVDGGSMRVVPVAQSTGTTPRPVNSRRVSTSSQCRRISNGDSSHDSRFSEMMQMMESSNRKLFRRSYREVLEDYDVMKARLAKARADNDIESEQLFDDLCKKLLAELQGCS